MQAYISLVKWLLSHYKGWNPINCNKIDSLIHTSSLTLKRVTEGSYWKESKQVPFPMISVLRTACSSARSYFPGTDKKQSLWEMAHKRRKCNILDPLKLNGLWQFPIFYFFIIGGHCRYFSGKGLDQMSLFSLNNFSWKAWYTANITTRIIISVTAPDPILCMMFWNHLWGSSPDNWSAKVFR